jgi:cob(I)alamin adenosyltransferase
VGVKLNKIYTRTGDDGTTGIVGGDRVAKNSQRIIAVGVVDEFNASIGTIRTSDTRMREMLRHIQNDLFDLGADISTTYETDNALRITAEQVEWLESSIDSINLELEPLQSFVLPGGNAAASKAHVARTVCRHAEREIVALSTLEQVNGYAISYINRLSDLLFVMARYLNDCGKSDTLWQPGANRTHGK